VQGETFEYSLDGKFNELMYFTDLTKRRQYQSSFRSQSLWERSRAVVIVQLSPH